MYCALFRFCLSMPVHTQNKHKKAVKNQCNLGTRMIKLENAGLRAPRKISLGSGLHSQKSIRPPVSKMIGLRAPQQKFQGSRAPGTPPFGTLEKAVFVTSASIFSETVGRMKLKFGEEIEKKLIYQDTSPFRWDFQYFCVNSSLKWRRSRLTAAKLQALSPSYVITRFNRHRLKLISL